MDLADVFGEHFCEYKCRNDDCGYIIKFHMSGMLILFINYCHALFG